MEYSLSENQELILEAVKEFAEAEIAPIAAEIDENERFPEENISQMAELGFFGIPIPEEYGGAGLGYQEYAVAVEEIAKHCASTAATVSAHTSLGCGSILKFGTEEQKKKYLPQITSGGKLAAFALTEPSAGTDAAGVKTKAVLKDDCYVLNGTKCFITNGKYADVYVIIAITDKDAGSKGFSAFIVEKGTPGFEFGAKERKLGIRGSATYELLFNDCKVPKENLLGAEGQGLKIALGMLDYGRIGMAAQAVGIAQGALDVAVEYTKQRIQFGKPISSFQYSQFKMADMKTDIEAARQLVYRAAWIADQGQPVGEAAAMAKLFAGRVARDVTQEAVQLMGGYGYTRDYPAERMMRDAKITEIYEGTSEAMRMVIAAKMGLK